MTTHAVVAGLAAPAEHAPCALGPTRPIDVKQLANTQARCALWGGTLSAIQGDDGRPLFVVARWALTRAFNDLDEVDRFLRTVGAPA